MKKDKKNADFQTDYRSSSNFGKSEEPLKPTGSGNIKLEETELTNEEE